MSETSHRLDYKLHNLLSEKAGNPKWRGRLHTVDLLNKIAFCEKLNNIGIIKSSLPKLVGTRRSSSLIPLRLGFPGEGQFAPNKTICLLFKIEFITEEHQSNNNNTYKEIESSSYLIGSTACIGWVGPLYLISII